MELRPLVHSEVTNVRPTYEELIQLVAELRATIRAQAEEIKLLKQKLYGKKSERLKKKDKGSGDSGQNPKPAPGTPRRRSLTEQYPDAEVQEIRIGFDHIPTSTCCGGPMADAYLEEVSEQLHTIPARHIIIRTLRRKFKCTRCFGGLRTAPMPPRIAPGSSLSNSFILEAIISKFYNLIPAERYAGMISQGGLKDFPPQLVLAAQHYGADFLKPVYEKIRKYIQSQLILHADETTHKMLERTDVESWYLWAFSAPGAYYFEIHDTRSSDVAIDFLKAAACVFLMSDVYVGYEKAVRIINELRSSQGLSELIALFCNAHARRKFVEAAVSYPDEAQFFIDQYAEVYGLEAELQLLNEKDSKAAKRAQARPYFEKMKRTGEQLLSHFSGKSTLSTAINYFLNNYVGLTRFLDDPSLPIDNNIAERQLRSPVIGRKTWYGTHSERGVETTEVLFTLMQTCRFLKINPREYLTAVTESILKGGDPYTPKEYLDKIPDKKSVA